MGINITLYRILKEVEDNDYGRPFIHYEKENIKEFDHLRYSGDREFMGRCGHFKDFDEEGQFIRPKDIDDSIEWVKKNVYEGNQKRLLFALNLMKEDPKVVFSVSY